MLGIDKEITSNTILGVAGSYSFTKQKSILNRSTYSNINTYLGVFIWC